MATINRYLADSVVKKATLLQKATVDVSQLLPTQFIGQCQVAEYTSDQITLAVSSPAWSNQLRYYLPLLKKKFPSQHIRILISPEMAGTYQRPTSKKPRELDAESAQSITNGASSIKDEKLRNTLLRIAEHGKKTD